MTFIIIDIRQRRGQQYNKQRTEFFLITQKCLERLEMMAINNIYQTI